MKLKDNEDLQDAIDSLRSHLNDKYDGPLGAIGFALDEDDPEQIEKACDELIDKAIQVRLAAYPEELENATGEGPRIILVSMRGYWAAGGTFWQAMRRLPCTPDLVYVTDDPEPVIYGRGGIGVHEGRTLVKIPLSRDSKDRVPPVEFFNDKPKQRANTKE